MNEENYWNLMNRYLSNELSLREAEDLLEWLNEDTGRADLLRELRDTWDRTKDYPESFKVDTSAAWQKLRSTMKDTVLKSENHGSLHVITAIWKFISRVPAMLKHL